MIELQETIAAAIPAAASVVSAAVTAAAAATPTFVPVPVPVPTPNLRVLEDDSGQMTYAQISLITLQAVFQTVIICLIGYWAARSGHLSRAVQKNISNLNVMVFTPCLIFSKMASSLSVTALVDLSLIPIFFVIATGVSFACGQLMSRRLGLSRPEQNYVTAMAVFGNSNSVPVSLTVALAYALPHLKWPNLPNDTPDNVASRGLLYLLIFQQLGQMLRWSWGYNTLLAPLSRNGEDPEAQPLDAGDVPSLTPEPENDKETIFRTLTQRIIGFMNPPLWAMFAALIVASVPALKNSLYGSGNGFVASTVGRAIQQVGGTAIPLILIVLGSNLAPPAPEDRHLMPPKSPNYTKIVVASLLCRMVLPAMVMLPLIAVCVKYLNISILDDPIFLLSSFILTVSPPAIQLAQICQLNQVFEVEMSGVLFWGYAVLSLPSSVGITVAALEVLEWAGISERSIF